MSTLTHPGRRDAGGSAGQSPSDGQVVLSAPIVDEKLARLAAGKYVDVILAALKRSAPAVYARYIGRGEGRVEVIHHHNGQSFTRALVCITPDEFLDEMIKAMLSVRGADEELRAGITRVLPIFLVSGRQAAHAEKERQATLALAGTVFGAFVAETKQLFLDDAGVK